MADGRDANPAQNPYARYPWLNIFRCFHIAVDPRKLIVAAAGILVMSFTWWLLSIIFWYKAPNLSDDQYSVTAILKKHGDKINPETEKPYSEEDAKKEATKLFNTDLEEWRVLDSLAGPGGKLRTLPWDEYRGPNPYLFVTDLISGSAGDRVNSSVEFLSGTVPVLVEPLNKFLLPIAKLISPGVSAQTRFYLVLILLSNIVVWAFCGGIITRIAAVQLANKGPISLRQAVRFVAKRYLGYLGSPGVLLIIIALVIVALFIYGLIFTVIPFVGDLLLLGIGLPLVILGGAIMAIFLVGLVGYPLMYTTLSAEGDQSDTFDSLSRSINYVYQSPWHYIWYWIVAIVYGVIVTFFVLFFTSLTVYVGKWAVSLPAGMIWSDRKPDFLFIYAPESFGWRELLTKDSPFAVRGQWERASENVPSPSAVPGPTAVPGPSAVPSPSAIPSQGTDRLIWTYRPVNPEAFKQARKEFWWYNTLAAWIVCFWMTIIFLLMLGFTYSFFWSAATMIYFLMRKKVDESELDEVFVEDEESPIPPLAPKIAEGTGHPSTTPTSLPVIPAPTPPVPHPVPSIPAGSPPLGPTDSQHAGQPNTIPFSPPSSGLDTPKTLEEKKKDEPPTTG